MRISERCAKCLYDRQKEKTDHKEYLAKVKELIENRSEEDTSPYLVYLFNQEYEKIFGKGMDYSEIKKTYNDLVLKMEDSLRVQIKESADPLAKALVMARIGNYIDFGAMDHVDEKTFLELFKEATMREADKEVYDSFLKECECAKSFLLICDNCGEIVLDKLFLEQLAIRFPKLSIQAMVRGGEVLNDVTIEDAKYVGLDKVAKVISNGQAISGTVYHMASDEAKEAIDHADVILAKGQGNYECMSGKGLHAFYAFLCKCDLFIKRFDVPKLTGVLTEE